MRNKTAEASGRIKVWDIGTRLFHWSLVVLFGMSAFSAFQDKFGLYADIHLWSGYGVLTLVSWRILWGFIGSDTARFGQFIKGPTATLAYFRSAFKKEPYRWVGHNPLGALSVLAMLMVLLVQAGLGLFATDDMVFSGPLSETITGRLAGNLTDLHKTIGCVLFGLVGLHLLVVILVLVRKKTNLVKPMITGNIEGSVVLEPAPKMRSPLRAFTTFLLIGSAYYFFIFQ